jgi:non-specific protein-tyrosine kinase
MRDRLFRRHRRPRGGAPARNITRDEAFRVLRSNLQVAIADLANPAVLVTSALPGEGKTSVCVNLAESLTLAGPRVVLVDHDLRNPASHRLLGAHNEMGVSDVLLNRKTLDECLQWVEIPGGNPANAVRGLFFLAAGTEIANPAELLATPRTGHLLDALAGQADIVLIDTPPILPVADSLVIGRLAAGAVMVVEARKTPVPAIQRAKDALIRNQTRLLGVVVNKMQSRDADYGLGYGIGYGVSSTEGVDLSLGIGDDDLPQGGPEASEDTKPGPQAKLNGHSHNASADHAPRLEATPSDLLEN